jgi:hypothetical protein
MTPAGGRRGHILLDTHGGTKCPAPLLTQRNRDPRHDNRDTQRNRYDPDVRLVIGGEQCVIHSRVLDMRL